MLRIRNLESGYGALRVIKGVSLHVSAGEVVTLIGPNGAGKSTLLSTIAGLLKPSAGQILFRGRDVATASTEEIVALGCSLVPEGRQIFSTLSVRENLLLGAYSRRAEGHRALHESLDYVYGLFGILREREGQLAGTLSGGEQQMLAIGRSLMGRPKLIMMDEPLLGVAPRIVQSIFETIVELKKSGITILLIEQNARAALRVANRGYVLETGRVACEGSSRELLDNHEVQRAYLGKDYRRIDE